MGHDRERRWEDEGDEALRDERPVLDPGKRTLAQQLGPRRAPAAAPPEDPGRARATTPPVDRAQLDRDLRGWLADPEDELEEPDALEASRGVRDAEGADDRASGRALRRSPEESIEEHRATLDIGGHDETYERVVYGEESSGSIDLGEDAVPAEPSAPRRRRKRAAHPRGKARAAVPRTARSPRKRQRLDAIPREVKLAAPVGTRVGPVPVHLLNRGEVPVEIAGMRQEVRADDVGLRPPGDFDVQMSSGIVESGGATAINVAFQPAATRPEDEQRPTSRDALFHVVDVYGRSIAKVKLRGMARPASAEARAWHEVAAVAGEARAGDVARPQTFADMRRHLNATRRLLAEGDRAHAAALVEAVHERLAEVMPPGGADAVFRKYGMGATTAVLTTGFAKTHVEILWRQLRSGATVTDSLAEQHITTFALAEEPLRELLGETDESPTVRAMHDSSPFTPVAETVADLVTDASFAGGFGLGVIEGVYGGVRDLFVGVVDTLELVGSTAFAMLTELGPACRRVAEKLAAFFDKAPDVLRALGKVFADRWHAPDSFERGNFRGEVVGYAVSQVALIIATGGAAAAALAGSGKWAMVVRLLRAADAAGDIFTYVGAAARTTWRIPSAVIRKLRGVGDAAEVAEDAVDAAHDVSRRASTEEPAPHAAPRMQRDGANDPLVLAGDDIGEITSAARVVKRVAGVLDVFVHGTVDDFIVRIGGELVHLDHRRLALWIRKSGQRFERVRLFACRSGMHPKGAAQQLANKLGVDVDAPTNLVFIKGDGTIIIGPDADRPTGKWETYSPKASASRSTVAKEPPLPSRAIDRYHARTDSANVTKDLPDHGDIDGQLQGDDVVEAGPGRGRQQSHAQGFAQRPRITPPWQPNPNGLVRRIDEVAAIAARHGVEMIDDVDFQKVAKKMLPPDTYARYGSRTSKDARQMIYWNTFMDDRELIAVQISEEVLGSDEAIVAVVAHEMHELRALKVLFDQRDGGMTVRELQYLVSPGRARNLHDEAWDVADRMVAQMRRKAESAQ